MHLSKQLPTVSFFIETNLCDQDPRPCDVDTTECLAKDGTPDCICKPGHISSLYQSRSCRGEHVSLLPHLCGLPCVFLYAYHNHP